MAPNNIAFLVSGGFTTMAVINPLDWKLTNCTSVQWLRLLARDWIVVGSNPSLATFFYLFLPKKKTKIELIYVKTGCASYQNLVSYIRL